MTASVAPASFQGLNFNSLCSVQKMKHSLFLPFSLAMLVSGPDEPTELAYKGLTSLFGYYM